jgi:hypothetical protein
MRQFGSAAVTAHYASVSFIVIIMLIALIDLPSAIASGVDPSHRRFKRTSADQRVAELEALMTLVNSRASLGHGLLDPLYYGRRRRQYEVEEETEDSISHQPVNSASDAADDDRPIDLTSSLLDLMYSGRPSTASDPRTTLPEKTADDIYGDDQ